MERRKPVALETLNNLLVQAFENDTISQVITEYVDIPKFIVNLPPPKKQKQLNARELEELLNTQTSPLLYGMMEEPLVNVFDMISPVEENYKLLIKYGLHPQKYTPTLIETERIRSAFTQFKCPRIINHTWIAKYVINLICLIIKTKKLPLWIKSIKKCIIRSLFNTLIKENCIKVEVSEIKIIVQHIYSEYITTEQLLILNNISVCE